MIRKKKKLGEISALPDRKGIPPAQPWKSLLIYENNGISETMNMLHIDYITEEAV